MESAPELQLILSELTHLRAEVQRLRQAPPAPQSVGVPANQPVTLSQMAGRCRLSKRTLDRFRKSIPGLVRKGKGGQSSLWEWRTARPWLERQFGLALPEKFPGY